MRVSSGLLITCLLGCLAWPLVSPGQSPPERPTTEPPAAPPAAPAPPEATPLIRGQVIEGNLASGETRHYQVSLAAGEFAVVMVGQVGVELHVAVAGDDGRRLEQLAGWNGISRARPVLLLADTATTCRITITNHERQAGAFFVHLTTHRPAADVDRQRFTAFETLQSAQRTRQKNTKAALESAVEQLHQALTAYQAANDADGEAETLVTLGLVYDNLGQTRRAIECYERTLPLRRASGEPAGLMQVFNNLARAYDQSGEKRRAVDYYRQAVAQADALRDHKSGSILRTNLGYTLDILGEKQEALDLLEQAVALARQASNPPSKPMPSTTRDSSMNPSACCRAPRNALNGPSASTASSTTGAPSPWPSPTWRVSTPKPAGLNRPGSPLKKPSPCAGKPATNAVKPIPSPDSATSALRRTSPNLGQRYFEQALVLRRETGDKRGEGVTLASLAATFTRLGQPATAQTHYEQALALFQAIGDRTGEANILYQLARLHRQAQDFPAACARIEPAIAIVENLRTKVAGQELRSAYFASVREYYNLYIDILMQLHRQQPDAGLHAQALHVSERARARSLLDLLAEANVSIRQGIDPELQNRERQLQSRLAAAADRLTILLVRQAPEPERQAMREEIASLSEEFDRTRREIRARHPHYAALTQPTPPTAAELQQRLLDANTVLLVYHLGEFHSYAWVLTPDRLTSFELLPGNTINAAARLFWQACQQPTHDPTADGEALAQLVLAPLAHHLTGQRLVIIADEGLHYVPFAALPDPRHPGRLLVERHELIHIPSATALMAQLQRTAERPAPKGELAVLADPVFDIDDPRLPGQALARAAHPMAGPPAETREIGLKVAQSKLTQAAQHAGLLADDADEDAALTIPRLPGTRREADAILALVPKSRRLSMTDFEANRENLLTGDLARYRILHIASHGLVDNERPELSSLLVSRFDATGQPREGVVGLPDIFNLQLSAELVVLSACKTGLGTFVRGEGLVGLTRGFMYAGASQIVVSLWSISDQSTARLMTHFYRALLRDKRPPAAALRQAQLDMRRESRYRHPFFWAPFQVHGQWAPAKSD
jgi:CHAT domain-containing protein/Flp pilus assembly protein TadD